MKGTILTDNFTVINTEHILTVEARPAVIDDDTEDGLDIVATMINDDEFVIIRCANKSEATIALMSIMSLQSDEVMLSFSDGMDDEMVQLLAQSYVKMKNLTTTALKEYLFTAQA